MTGEDNVLEDEHIDNSGVPTINWFAYIRRLLNESKESKEPEKEDV